MDESGWLPAEAEEPRTAVFRRQIDGGREHFIGIDVGTQLTTVKLTIADATGLAMGRVTGEIPTESLSVAGELLGLALAAPHEPTGVRRRPSSTASVGNIRIKVPAGRRTRRRCSPLASPRGPRSPTCAANSAARPTRYALAWCSSVICRPTNGQPGSAPDGRLSRRSADHRGSVGFLMDHRPSRGPVPSAEASAKYDH